MSQWAWDRFVEVADTHPEAMAVRQGETSATFSQLRNAGDLRASGMRLAPGDRAVVCAENSISVLETILAIWRRGAIPVLVNSRAPEAHIQHALDASGAAIGFADPELVARDPRLCEIEELTEGHSPASSDLPPHDRSGADTGSIVFTSGSTGLPKGVMQRADTLIDGASRIGRLMGYGRDDAILCPVPFAFDYGWGQALSLFFEGVPLILPAAPNSFELCAAIDRHRPTVLAAVPSLLAELAFGLAPIGETDCTSIRLITNTGSKIPDSVFEAAKSYFPNAAFSLNYGLTETYRGTSLPVDLADKNRNSIGLPVEGVEIIVRRENGSIADAGEVGELCHLGAGCFQGYWGDPEKTAEVLQDFTRHDGTTVKGVRTGDYGWRDEDGLIYLKGRRDRIVKCMGVRISLAEIEDAIYANDLVREAAVIALDHDIFGSFLVAHIAGGEESLDDEGKSLIKQLRKDLRGRLTNYMQPRKFVVHRALPRTGSSKFDLARLKSESAVD